MLSVIVPVYNERETVGQVLAEISSSLTAVAHEIIVVDDGSTDGSGESLEEINGIKLIRQSENCGYGYSIKAGIMEARGENIAIIDADGTYPAGRIPEMLALMNTHQMVVAARKPLPPAKKPLLPG